MAKFDKEGELLVLEAAVGSAIHSWSLVEEQLCITFTTLITAKITPSAVAAFYAIRSFEGRLSATDSALKSSSNFPEYILKDWKRLKDKLSKKNKKRNEIAHSAVITLKDDAGHPEEVLVMPLFNSLLEASTREGYEDLKHFGIKIRYPYLTTQNLNERGRSFMKLEDEMRKFNLNLMEAPPKHLEK